MAVKINNYIVEEGAVGNWKSCLYACQDYIIVRGTLDNSSARVQGYFLITNNKEYQGFFDSKDITDIGENLIACLLHNPEGREITLEGLANKVVQNKEEFCLEVCNDIKSLVEKSFKKAKGKSLGIRLNAPIGYNNGTTQYTTQFLLPTKNSYGNVISATTAEDFELVLSVYLYYGRVYSPARLKEMYPSLSGDVKSVIDSLRLNKFVEGLKNSPLPRLSAENKEFKAAVEEVWTSNDAGHFTPESIIEGAESQDYIKLYKLVNRAEIIQQEGALENLVLKQEDYRMLFPEFKAFKYQFDTVLSFFNDFNGKAVLADQVGMGKSIETAMILSELAVKPQNRFSSILFVVPRRLVQQWIYTMNLFGLQLTRFTEREFLENSECQRYKNPPLVWRHLSRKDRREVIAMWKTASPKEREKRLFKCSVFFEKVKTTIERELNKPIEELRQNAISICNDNNAWDKVKIPSVAFGRSTSTNRVIMSEDEFVKLNLYNSDREESDLKISYAIDVLVVDELHKIFTSAGKCVSYEFSDPIGKFTTASSLGKSFRNIGSIMPKTSRAIFLSATPIQGRLRDMFPIIKLLRPETVARWSTDDEFIKNCCKGIKSLKQLRLAKDSESLQDAIRQVYRLIAFRSSRDNASKDNSAGFDKFVVCEKESYPYYLEANEVKLEKIKQIINANSSKKIVIFVNEKEEFKFLSQQLAYLDSKRFVLNAKTANTTIIQDQAEEEADEMVQKSIVEAFNRAEGGAVLLADHLCSEGLNLQSASVLINYSIELDPVKMEQRVGRIDRIGQQAQSIAIHSFAEEGGLSGYILKWYNDTLKLFSSKWIGDILAVIGMSMGAEKTEDYKDADFIDYTINKFLGIESNCSFESLVETMWERLKHGVPIYSEVKDENGEWLPRICGKKDDAEKLVKALNYHYSAVDGNLLANVKEFNTSSLINFAFEWERRVFDIESIRASLNYIINENEDAEEQLI